MKTLPQVRLRAFERTDLDRMHRAFNNPVLRRFLAPEAAMPLSREEEAAFLENCLTPRQKDIAYDFAVETSKGLLLGGCGYHHFSSKDRTCHIGISIYEPRLWGQGYGTAALGKLLEFLFLEKNVRKVLLTVYDFNKRAVACYERLGFKQEGRLARQVYRDGKYNDLLVMALFAEDFKNAVPARRATHLPKTGRDLL